MKSLACFLFGSSRRLLALIALACLGLLGYAFYLQHALNLEPCPMCIVQRYAFIALMVAAFVGSLWGHKIWVVFWGALALAFSGFGAFVAARQSWLQWNPPEFSSCGRDFYGVIEGFPLRDALPMLFRGTGDCSAVDWTFLGGTIANWSFIMFALFFVVLVVLGISRSTRKCGV